MNCRTAKDRLDVSQFWFSKIKEFYLDSSEVVEYYLESFLISCRSVPDYVVRDFLNTIKPDLTLAQRLFINSEKINIVDGNKPLPEHEMNDNILAFLKEHSLFWNELYSNLLVRYLFTKRNVIIHHTFSGMYGPVYDDSGENIIRRHFEASGMNLLVENGSKLLAEDGSPIILENGNSLPIDDFVIRNISQKDKEKLMNLITTTDAIKLLADFLSSIRKFVQHFESYEISDH